MHDAHHAAFWKHLFWQSHHQVIMINEMDSHAFSDIYYVHFVYYLILIVEFRNILYLNKS